jgi:hypothetical protein
VERQRWGLGERQRGSSGLDWSNSRSGHTGSTHHRRSGAEGHSQMDKRVSQKARSGDERGSVVVCTENGISGDAVWLRVSSD